MRRHRAADPARPDRCHGRHPRVHARHLRRRRRVVGDGPSLRRRGVGMAVDRPAPPASHAAGCARLARSAHSRRDRGQQVSSRDPLRSLRHVWRPSSASRRVLVVGAHCGLALDTHDRAADGDARRCVRWASCAAAGSWLARETCVGRGCSLVAPGFQDARDRLSPHTTRRPRRTRAAMGVLADVAVLRPGRSMGVVPREPVSWPLDDDGSQPWNP